MGEISLNVEELGIKNGEPQVAFVLSDEDRQLLRREAKLFSEDDIIASSDEIMSVTNRNKADVDQIIAGEIEPIRLQWLRDRENEDQQAQAGQNPAQQVSEVPARYAAFLPGADGSGGASIRDVVKNTELSNFVLRLNEDIAVQDDVEFRREFAGRLTVGNRTVPFRISAADYADNGKLRAAGRPYFRLEVVSWSSIATWMNCARRSA